MGPRSTLDLWGTEKYLVPTIIQILDCQAGSLFYIPTLHSRLSIDAEYKSCGIEPYGNLFIRQQ